MPINALVAVEGTPIGDSGKAKRVDVFEMVRMIAAARIICPRPWCACLLEGWNLVKENKL